MMDAARVEELTERVEALEVRLAAVSGQQGTALLDDCGQATSDEQVETLVRDALAGSATAVLATRLAALSNPVRLQILSAILVGVTSAGRLAELRGMGTTGQIYHHLRILVDAGWLYTPTRGEFRVPKERSRALVAIIAAATS